METEQERKFRTTWVITALIHLVHVVGEKQRINTKEDQIFTGQDI